MKNNGGLLLIYVWLLLSGFFSVCFMLPQSNCNGQERWAQKTLTDPEAKKVNFKPITITVSGLRAFKPSQKSGNNTTRFGEEFNTYSVICKIRQFLVETDGDYHIVLVDLMDSTQTMIAEIPDPNCESVKKSKYLKKFAAARSNFEKYMTTKGKIQSGNYQLTGVCLYDHPHGQTGVAPNAIEIHPVLSFTKLK